MYTAKELAAMLQMSVKTIYRYVELGLIPYVKIQSNIRFPEEPILAWIEEHYYNPCLVNGNGARMRHTRVLA